MPVAAAISQSVEQLSQRARALGAPAHIEAAVRQASARTGVDFSYLLEKAAVESSFRTDIKASTSSAVGLYQFLDSTWLDTLKAHGAKHGYGQFASAIQTRGDGRSYVADPEMRRQILDLRKDPKASALMAAEFTRENVEHLEKNVGGRVGATEMYMAHFLGAGGAAKFLNAMKDAPNQKAADLFPAAAAANRAVFYDRTSGEPKTLKEVYDRFATKFDDDIQMGKSPTNAFIESLRLRDVPDGFTTPVHSRDPRALGANPLSVYTILALNALETPDEADDDRAVGNGKDDRKRMRDEPVRTDQTDGGAELGFGMARGLGLTGA